MLSAFLVLLLIASVAFIGRLYRASKDAEQRYEDLLNINEVLTKLSDKLNDKCRQQAFLLSQAPMQNAPENAFLAALAVTKYAYIHPMTLAKLLQVPPVLGNIAPPTWGFAPSPTRWVATPLMPKGCVIYTPNRMEDFNG